MRLILAVAALVVHVNSDQNFYAAVTQLEDVFHNEGKLISQLEKMLNNFEEKASEIKQKISELQESRKNATDIAEFFYNPINSFLYLKSIDKFLSSFNTIIKNPANEFSDFMKDVEENIGWPGIADVEGAANALLRLQTTYNLEIDDMIQGKILNNETTPFSAEDCYILGVAGVRLMYNSEDEYNAIAWLEKAFTKCENEDCLPELRINITEYYAYVHFIHGNLTKSLEFTELLLKLKPGYERALSNKQFLLNTINKSQEGSEKFMADPTGRYSEDLVYPYACQGLLRISNEIKNSLKCRYVHHNNPYLMLGPAKQEEAYLDPKIVVYKDLVTDSEIKVLQSVAKEQLERSETFGGVDDKTRVSKVAWLDNNEDIVQKLRRRFGIYSDLFSDSAEFLQMVNYGLGGHYTVHIDAPEKNVWGSLGNRIATFLIYFNNVDKGGETVFPNLGVSVKPEKGSAVMWFNLHPDGSTDRRTLHAACPVVVGTKWAANLWFHEAGQEFTRPCPLNKTQIKMF